MPSQGDLFQDEFARSVIETSFQDEMSESFLAYSLSVITSRAIPDVRDGLKPVQRRILYSMNNMGLRPTRPHRKCAGVVGDTMGKYHPHGDSSIYDALTRMGQDFSRNITLVDPHGNFGSLDDPPAAYRYTECRLAQAAEELLGEIDEETVEFRPTFDGERDEPIYLPAKLPNLLVNGTTGIAVGMATNMAPHNLGEIYEAIKLVMTQRRPKPTVAELMKCVPGPDFPSGGVIIDEGIADAYETGRGSFRIRASAEIVKLTKARQGIVISELPYMVGPERVISRIQDLIRDGKLMGISDVKNLSDRRSGLNITIECKPGVNARGVLTELFRMTPLEESFGVNNVALVNGAPTTMGLWELCNHYAEHRLDIVRRRTSFRLGKAQARLHIIEGLLIALDAIDLVISIIRSSQDASEARVRLIAELSLTEIQASHILDMQLRRLTALERIKLHEEAEELRSDIVDYEKILASDQRQRTIVLKELETLVEQFKRPRRSRIMTPEQVEDVAFEMPSTTDGEAEMTDDPCSITFSSSGVVGREPTSGSKQSTFGRHDVVSERIASSLLGRVSVITSGGRVLTAPTAMIPEVTGRTRGAVLREIFALQKGEELLAAFSSVPVGTADEVLEAPTMLFTKQGVAKRVTLREIIDTQNTKDIIKLKGDDAVVAVFPAPDAVDIVAVSSDAQALRVNASAVSVQGRGAGGVAGMKLSSGATVLAAGPVNGDCILLTQTDKHAAKVTDPDEIATKGRNTSGVRVTKFRDDKRIEFAYVGPEQGLQLVLGTEDAPAKPDPAPQPLTIEHTGRDLMSKPMARRILAVGTGRW